MKEHLLQIIYELSKNSYFDECIIEISINFDSIIGFNKKIFKDSIDEYLDIINNTTNIESYNLTLTTEIGDLYKYKDDWQRTSFIFYSCDDENLDTQKYASFDFNTSGKSPRDNSLSNVGLQHILNGKNEYNFENLSTLIECMVGLDEMINRHQKEKMDIFNEFSDLI